MVELQVDCDTLLCRLFHHNPTLFSGIAVIVAIPFVLVLVAICASCRGHTQVRVKVGKRSPSPKPREQALKSHSSENRVSYSETGLDASILRRRFVDPKEKDTGWFEWMS